MKKYTIGRNQERQVVIEGSGEYVVELVGYGARVEILGALDVGGLDKLVIDVTTIHKAPKTSADTMLRAVVRDQAKVVINGLIKVSKKAQKTEAFLSEKVLLLSDKAQAEVIPNLEIEADDVRASHAATVGKIDEEQVYYFMSRGIARDKAKEMIVGGFLDVVHERMKEQ